MGGSARKSRATHAKLRIEITGAGGHATPTFLAMSLTLLACNERPNLRRLTWGIALSTSDSSLGHRSCTSLSSEHGLMSLLDVSTVVRRRFETRVHLLLQSDQHRDQSLS